ncbi:hypothetical protein F0L74_19105 [Chitinophaga agrisoli]|uniref:Uncharacterized protein n=1 Tax=Chitinophaga agrisoli TaxID=2607653 RepID=A0A5B2VUU6_9BACT|nr:hypothetical protein [Chitinophaga agrisoli]KAA2241966.1 hypothetical protein F0L74_19105 [Chitinophaga agrisoli]
MIRLHDVKTGDTVLVQYEGDLLEGKVLEVNPEDKQACVLTHEQQEFWYDFDSLYEIPLDETQLLRLKFQKDEAQSSNGSGALYIRGPFSVRLYQKDGHEMTLLSYRDEHRDLKGTITVNQLQNHYHGMTNFHLD